MFRELGSTVGKWWCGLTHDSPMWPVHGHYECGACGRRYPAFEETPVASHPRRRALEPSVSLSRLALVAAILAAGAAQCSRAAELQPATLQAWNAYVARADSQMQRRGAGGGPFLWVGETPERLARVRRGEVVIAPVAGRGSESVPGGLIHDWVGAVFIPGATLDGLWAVVHDYDRYRQIYRPVVTASRTLACGGAGQEFQMTWQRRVLFVSAAMQGRYRNHDVLLDGNHRYSVVDATEVREIAGYGHPDQHLLPPDTGNGFIWRIRSITRFEERDGGVYMELEAMALTRDIPFGLSWLVAPVVNRLSVNSLAATLKQTRDAVNALHSKVETLASCPHPVRLQGATAGME